MCGVSFGIIGVENIYSECKKQLSGFKHDLRHEFRNEVFSSSHNNEYNELQKEMNDLKSMYKNNNKSNEMDYTDKSTNTDSYAKVC